MDTVFHRGDNTDYQYRKPSRALGQKEILPSIPMHNLLVWGAGLFLRLYGGQDYSCAYGGQDSFLPQAPLRDFLHPEAWLEDNLPSYAPFPRNLPFMYAVSCSR